MYVHALCIDVDVLCKQNKNNIRYNIRASFKPSSPNIFIYEIYSS